MCLEYLVADKDNIDTMNYEEMKSLMDELKINTNNSNEKIMRMTYLEWFESYLSSNKPLENITMITSCRHVFHNTCFKKWFVKNNKCAVCRKTIDDDRLYRENDEDNHDMVSVNEDVDDLEDLDHMF